MEYREFGSTGHNISILTLGGWGVGFIKQTEANKYIQHALDMGINIIDVAPTYGRAEKRLGPWIDQYREKLFLAEKTQKRSKEEAWEELQQSLKNLKTDYFNLYQFHAVSTKEDLEKIFSKGGALEAFEEAKESDIINNIGITGHDNMQILIEAINRYDFNTVLCPIYLGAMVAPDPINDFRPLLEIAQEKKMGVTAIKSIAKSRWTRKKIYNTWYEPLEDQEWINMAINFTLNQKGVSTYSLAGEKSLWSPIFSAIENFHSLSHEEIQEMIREAKDYGIKPLFPEK